MDVPTGHIGIAQLAGAIQRRQSQLAIYGQSTLGGICQQQQVGLGGLAGALDKMSDQESFECARELDRVICSQDKNSYRFKKKSFRRELQDEIDSWLEF